MSERKEGPEFFFFHKPFGKSESFLRSALIRLGIQITKLQCTTKPELMTNKREMFQNGGMRKCRWGVGDEIEKRKFNMPAASSQLLVSN